MNLLNNKKNNKLNNNGVAMISVIIVLTVCMLVATIVIELTYTSLLSRQVNRVAAGVDYKAEAIVDDMESVLQGIAYYTVENGSGDFINSVYSSLEASAGVASGDSEDQKNNKIADYIFSNLSDSSKKSIGYGNASTGYTRTDADSNSNFSVKSYTNSSESGNDKKSKLVIQVEFSYLNDKGYLSKISTELVMNDVATRKNTDDYPLGSYSMFTGGGATIASNSNEAQNGSICVYKQEGNAYMGLKEDGTSALYLWGGNELEITGAAIVNGDIYLSDGAYLVFSGTNTIDDGTRPEITIRGTIYIDSTSVLVINDKYDFLCKDIVLVEGKLPSGKQDRMVAPDISGYSQRSIFDANSAGDSYLNYNGTKIYGKDFPFKPSAGSNDYYKTALTTKITKGNLDEDVAKGSPSIGGCVMASTDSGSYIIDFSEYQSNKKINLIGGATVSKKPLINSSPYCIPEAKTTIQNWDGTVLKCDAALSRFVNVDLLAWMGTVPNTVIGRQQSWADLRDGITSSAADIAAGNLYSFGNSYERNSDDESAKYTLALNNNPATYATSKKFNGLSYITKADGSEITRADIQTNTKSSSNVVTNKDGVVISLSDLGIDIDKNVSNSEVTSCKAVSTIIGKTEGSVLHSGPDAIDMMLSWDNLKVHIGNGGTIIGMYVCRDCAYFEPQAGGFCIAKSFLQADKVNYDIPNLLNSLQYACFMRTGNDNFGSYAGNYYGNNATLLSENAYRMWMLDNLITGGLMSMNQDNGAGNTGGGGFNLHITGMYDFITVENWQQNN